MHREPKPAKSLLQNCDASDQIGTAVAACREHGRYHQENRDAPEKAFSGLLLLLSLGSGVVKKYNINSGIRLWIMGLRLVHRWQGFTTAVFDPHTILVFLMKLAADAGKT